MKLYRDVSSLGVSKRGRELILEITLSIPNPQKEKREKEKKKTHRHTQHPRPIMPPLQPTPLILKTPRPVHTRTARSIAINEVSSLDHEILDDAVEARTLVALRSVEVVAGFARAELAEVLGGARDGVGVEEHLNAA